MLADVVRRSGFSAIRAERCLDSAKGVRRHALTFLHLGHFSFRYAHFQTPICCSVELKPSEITAIQTIIEW